MGAIWSRYAAHQNVDHAHRIAAAFDGSRNLRLEAGETIDQRGHAAYNAGAVAKGARGQVAAVGWQVDYGEAADEAVGIDCEGCAAPGWRKTMRSTSWPWAR